MPCFGVPKKNGTIQLVIKFRQLIDMLRRKEYLLHIIDEIFQNICGFIFASVIDLNLGYLSILLTASMQKMLNMAATFRFFECCILSVGIKPITDIFQTRMVGIFQSMCEYKPHPYIDDILH